MVLTNLPTETNKASMLHLRMYIRFGHTHWKYYILSGGYHKRVHSKTAYAGEVQAGGNIKILAAGRDRQTESTDRKRVSAHAHNSTERCGWHGHEGSHGEQALREWDACHIDSVSMWCEYVSNETDFCGASELEGEWWGWEWFTWCREHSVCVYACIRDRLCVCVMVVWWCMGWVWFI